MIEITVLSKQQKGFVPSGRQITDLVHQVNVIQIYKNT